MDNDVRALVVGFLLFALHVFAIYWVVNYALTQTDLNNGMVALCGLGTAVIIGGPIGFIVRATQS